MNLLLFILVFQSLIPQFVVSLSSDGLYLLSLKSSMQQAATGKDSPFSNWDENDVVPCNWTGVSCMKFSGYSEPRVVGLTLVDKGIRGYIPSEFGSLLFLRHLNLQENELSGAIPFQLFNSTSLRSISLYNNNLTGILPPTVCDIPHLQNLDLSQNKLSGTLPHSLINCRQLQRLLLAGNRFSGVLPSRIWQKMRNLVQLDLSRNNFNGSLPADLGELKSLSGSLNLSFNKFSGQIPPSLEKLPASVNLDLRGNNFTGEIPQSGSFANQGPAAFLNNPRLCGFPPQINPCRNNSWMPSGNANSESRSAADASREMKPTLITLISVADAVVVALIGLLLVYVRWRRRDSSNFSCTRNASGEGDSEEVGSCLCWRSFSEPDSEKIGDEGREGDLVAIDKGFTCELDELLRASAYVLGRSGTGIVYKVVLGSGVPVAVRRLGGGGEERRGEFAAAVGAIARVKHPNIVRVRAYFWAPDEKLLISDFISNGNLRTALRGRAGEPQPGLPWATRVKIARGAARGLAHLHEKFAHGDIKPSNILLDSEFNPYISDLGLHRLARLTGGDVASTSTGSIGSALPSVQSTRDERANIYKAPEARVPASTPSQKADVYSFGVVLLEILTGNSLTPSAAPSSSTTERPAEPVKWLRKCFQDGSPLTNMVDPVLVRGYTKEVLAMLRVALACTETDPELRPGMKAVSQSLERIRNY